MVGEGLRVPLPPTPAQDDIPPASQSEANSAEWRSEGGGGGGRVPHLLPRTDQLMVNKRAGPSPGAKLARAASPRG